MQSLFLKYAAFSVLAAAGTMLGITAWLVAVGSFSEPELPQGFSSHRQLLGINLLLIAVPSYLVAAWGLSLRRSVRLLGAVDARLGSPEFADVALTPPKFIAIGATVGFLYGVLFNLPISTIGEFRSGGTLLVSLVLLMILVWVTAGMVLASRLYIASLFYRAGRRIPVDPYDLTPLEPFARSGIGDVALTIGVLVLASVQSIDATFRYQNYLFSTIVAIPAAMVLLFLPMQTLHTRLKDLKKRELAEVREMIRAMPKSLTMEHVSALEPLLQRRDRVESLATWPLNLAMVSRLLIYGVIPPAAWVGAALVERFVEGILEG